MRFAEACPKHRGKNYLWPHTSIRTLFEARSTRPLQSGDQITTASLAERGWCCKQIVRLLQFAADLLPLTRKERGPMWSSWHQHRTISLCGLGRVVFKRAASPDLQSAWSLLVRAIIHRTYSARFQIPLRVDNVQVVSFRCHTNRFAAWALSASKLERLLHAWTSRATARTSHDVNPECFDPIALPEQDRPHHLKEQAR